MSDVRTALAVVVARGLRGDELSAEAAAVLDREIERLHAVETRAQAVRDAWARATTSMSPPGWPRDLFDALDAL